MLCCRDGARIEGGDPSRKCIDKAVQLFIWKRAVDVPILCRSIAVEVVGAKNDFERAAATDHRRGALGASASWTQFDSHFRKTPQRVFARRKTPIANAHEFASDPAHTTS